MWRTQMRRSIILLAAVAALVLPVSIVQGRSVVVDDYTREESPLPEGATEVYESIVVLGPLTPELRAIADWQTIADQGSFRIGVNAADAAVNYKTVGFRYAAYNALGWLVIQYTIWQEFGYDGTKITYFPSPTYDHAANWGWSLKSHSESHWWITNPTYATARGTYFFKQEFPTPFGGIGLQEKSGWCQVWIRGNGTYSGSGA